MKARGMHAPKLVIGDGAFGFWLVLDEIYSESCHQYYWVHRTENALNALPKSAQTKMKEALQQIWMAET